MKSVTITVFGKVQGVFYRANTKEQAERLHLKGYVKNQANGSVYIEASGNSENIKQLVLWCHQGSEFSAVDRVEVVENELKVFENFEIRR